MSFMRAKKFFVSRLGDSKLGRAQLLKQVGDDTAAMLEALAALILQWYPAHAAKVNKRTLKLAAKVALLWSEGVIGPTDVPRLQEAAVAASLALLEKFAASAASGGAPVDPSPLPALVSACAAALLPALHGHVKESSAAKVAGLAAFYGDADFLDRLICAPEAAEARERLQSTLGTFLGPRRPPRPLKCSLAGCDVPRALLRGSQFCLGHHVLKFAHGPPPQLSDWLRNADYALLFRDFLVAPGAALAGPAAGDPHPPLPAIASSAGPGGAAAHLAPAPSYTAGRDGEAQPPLLALLDLWQAIQDFREVSNRALLLPRAEALVEHHLRGKRRARPAPLAAAAAPSVTTEAAEGRESWPASDRDASTPVGDGAAGDAAVAVAVDDVAVSVSPLAAGGSAEAEGVTSLLPPEEVAAVIRCVSDAGFARLYDNDGGGGAGPRSRRAQSTAVSHRLFDALSDAAYARLQGLYAGPFRETPAFMSWAAENLGLRPPPISAARAALLAAAGIDPYEATGGAPIAEVLPPPSGGAAGGASSHGWRG